MARRLLLISNSTHHGEGYLDHCFDEMRDFLGAIDRVAFVPFALADQAAYGKAFSDRLRKGGLETSIVTPDDAGRRIVEGAEALFIGGGNTFRLLATLERLDLVELLRRRVGEGMAYMGASAGSNVAAPTIRTTNDMPIVQPGSFAALGLVAFQINPHYIDADPGSTHMGETREQRLKEYLEENERPVVAIREGAWIRVEGGEARLGGVRGARIFRRGVGPEERPPGAALDDLL